MKTALSAWALGLLAAVAASPVSAEVSPRITVKFVVVTDLDLAGPRGHPGVLEAWVSGEHFGQTFRSPGVQHLVAGDGHGSLAVLIGSGSQAAIQLMALIADERFDFSSAYWLLTGVGFANPEQLSLGSVAWGTAVVDGDTAYEVDRADAPPDWPYGVVPLAATNVPADYPVPSPHSNPAVVVPLNLGLAKLAYSLSKDLKLPDLPEARTYRATYGGYAGAIRPPSILSGVVLGTTRTWHGKALNLWAKDWVQFWSPEPKTEKTGKKAKKKENDEDKDKAEEKDPFLIGDTSDQAAVAALATAAQMGRVDFSRVMIVRGAGGYTLPPPDQVHDQSLAPDFPGLNLAIANVFLAGRPIFHEITGNWDQYAHETPQDHSHPEKAR
jgi:purine nucleoside permease